jgi:hypothetical protein
MPKTQGTRISEDWQPSDKDKLAAQKLGLTPGQTAWVRDRFVRHFTGPDAKRPVKKDWSRAWLNWIEGDVAAAKRAVRQEAMTGSTPIVAGTDLALWRIRMQGWMRNKFWPINAGPRPDEGGCYAPRVILREFGLEKKGAGPQVAAPAPNVEATP